MTISEVKNESVDLLGSGDILIGTTSALFGEFRPLFVTFEVVNISSLAGLPDITIGIVDPTYNEILASPYLGSLDLAGGLVSLLGCTFENFYKTSISAKVVPINTSIFLKVLTPAVATAYTVKVSVIGVYDI